MADLLPRLADWYQTDPDKAEDFCIKFGGATLLAAVTERAEIQQELRAREADLAKHLSGPPMDSDIGRQRYAEHTARILFSINELERMLGIEHVQVVA